MSVTHVFTPFSVLDSLLLLSRSAGRLHDLDDEAVGGVTDRLEFADVDASGGGSSANCGHVVRRSALYRRPGDADVVAGDAAQPLGAQLLANLVL